jgi:hypothetical protein
LRESPEVKSVIAMACTVAALLGGCAQPAPSPEAATSAAATESNDAIAGLVATVRADAAKKPLLVRALMAGNVWMIPDPHSTSLAPLPVYQNERSFIPVFSDRRTFDQEAYGTGFEGKAIVVDAARFASLLHGDEIVILNPGHRPAIEFHASELKAGAGR